MTVIEESLQQVGIQAILKHFEHTIVQIFASQERHISMDILESEFTAHMDKITKVVKREGHRLISWPMFQGRRGRGG